MNIHGILEACLYCSDLEAAERFYAGVLGLQVHTREAGRHVFFRCGEAMLLVFDPDTTATEESEVNGSPIPLHGARGAGHVAFRASEAELPAWRERLEAEGIEIESEVDWPNGARSIYFRDPAGNSVEVATPELWAIE
jgi:catechol 2,3-dioxygenase-like lactoylglutathione lyase family enzyme